MIILKEILKIDKLKYIYNSIKNINKLNILEFGVKEGYSTKLFLNLVKKNQGNLVSVDVNKSINDFKSKRWTFLQTRDDDFLSVKKKIKKKIDVIYIDSYHEPEHIKKIFYYYYSFLKINGLIFIDDISWLPYVQKNHLNNEFNENINRDTFDKLLEIYIANQDILRLDFNFDQTGTAKFKKISLKKLNPPVKISSRKYSIKNIVRNIFNIKPKS